MKGSQWRFILILFSEEERFWETLGGLNILAVVYENRPGFFFFHAYAIILVIHFALRGWLQILKAAQVVLSHLQNKNNLLNELLFLFFFELSIILW